MAQGKYLEKTVINLTRINEEIKGRPNSGNACYHLVQNLSSLRLPKNLKIKRHTTITLPVATCGCEAWCYVEYLAVKEGSSRRLKKTAR